MNIDTPDPEKRITAAAVSLSLGGSVIPPSHTQVASSQQTRQPFLNAYFLALITVIEAVLKPCLDHLYLAHSFSHRVRISHLFAACRLEPSVAFFDLMAHQGLLTATPILNRVKWLPGASGWVFRNHAKEYFGFRFFPANMPSYVRENASIGEVIS